MRPLIPNLNCESCESRFNGIFCELEKADTKEFDKKKVTNHYKKGQVIFYEGNQPFGLYCVFSGKVKLYKTGVDGKPQILRIAGPGGVLGYRALCAEESYHATAEMLQGGEVCFLDRHVFFKLIEQNPSLGKKVISKLAQELRRAEELATSLAQRSARERMAELILTLQENYGRPNGEGIEIELELSREEMAGMVGMAQETAIRLLSEFKGDGLIRLKDRKITVIKPQGLRQTAAH